MYAGKLLAGALLAATAIAATGQASKAASLADLTLEQLSGIVVSSVSGREESLARAAASIYVISADEIRRSGATSLPQALRLAPNLGVAQVDANQYAISARGFNSTTANKLLVLIDGRTIYTPLFSGTFWDVQDVMLDDVERIEVISGPGAALWGANAVNGVINVITRPASATQGGLATGALGSNQKDAAARYGGAIAGGHFRVYGKTLRRDASVTSTGAAFRDDGDMTQVGFRADWGRGADGFTLQGDAYRADFDMAPQRREASGANLLARWRRDLGDNGALMMQGYIDYTARHHPTIFREHLQTYDFELQHQPRASGAHKLIWGLGARHYRDDVENSPGLAFLPPQRSLRRGHVFAQDEIALRPDLDLTVGAKIEGNSYTGAEFLPSVRLGWRPSATALLWGAASRAVRAPSRIDREFFSPQTPPFVVLAGGPDFRSEVSNVYELGYRAQATPDFSYSVTAFYHRHDHLRTLTASPAGPVLSNESEGHTQGVEGWANWRVRDWLRLSGGATSMRQHLRTKPGAVDLLAPGSNGNDPSGWYKLRASIDLSPRHELDLMLRHYASLPAPSVPAYTALDARLAWRAAPNTELSLLVQNLTDRRHPEWGAVATRAEMERAVLLRLRLGI
jgi:iron complex outermembrane receptor protein